MSSIIHPIRLPSAETAMPSDQQQRRVHHLPGPPRSSPIAHMRRFIVSCNTSKKRPGDEGVPLEKQETEGILFSSGVVVLDAALTPFINLEAMKSYLREWGNYAIRWIDR